MSDNKDTTKKEVDPELDDLLDSALQDMTKKEVAKEDTKAEGSSDGDAVWSADFIKEAAAQFESNMHAILSNFNGVSEEQITQEQIAETFSKMAEAAAHVMKPGNAESSNPSLSDQAAEKDKIDEVSAAINETLQNLNTNAENLQQPFTEQDFTNMFGNLNFGEGGVPEGNMFVPFMQGMMQSLLSKEVLYPSLKELVEKYPKWLAENKGKIDQNEYERYEQQQALMEQVCSELESEQESDPEDVKRKRFEKVLELMQKMQDLGQPPTDLVGDVATTPQFGGYATPSAQDLNQCAIM